MTVVIKVEKLSKRFRLGTLRQKDETLRDLLANGIKNLFAGRVHKGNSDILWALRNVSFEIEQGSTLGIIGGNGAGKSTLLKILSRITKPTEGRIKIEGRVGSLLEVGTGFHQDLTGRENVFLNGAILGMRRREVSTKFDEIIAFAEVERFIDTPVKFYSTGMYTRLAFAVAAHFEPEILIIDEVLAVGDAAFQKKCLGKMNEVANDGRTVIFVSHNAGALHEICRTGLYLERGQMKSFGEIKTVLAQYQADNDENNFVRAEDRQNPSVVRKGEVRFINWQLIDASTKQPYTMFSREKGCFEFTLVCKRPALFVHFKLTLFDEQNNEVYIAHNLSGGVRETELEIGIYKLNWRCELPIKAGTYRFLAEVYSDYGEGVLDAWEALPRLTILPVAEHSLATEFQGIVNTPVAFGITFEKLL